VFEDLFYIRYCPIETAVFPVDILGITVEAEYNRKFMRIQGLENPFCDQTAVGCQGILGLFAILLIFFVEEGYCLFYQIETEKGFSSVEIEVVMTGQER